MLVPSSARILAAALFLAPITRGLTEEESSMGEMIAEQQSSVGEAIAAETSAPVESREVLEMPESEGGGFSLFPGLKVDVSGSGSYIYDSNTAQTQNGPSASLFAFAYGANVKTGEEDKRGGYYGVELLGQYFVYDEAASAMGRDPYEQFLSSYFGLNGGKTKIRLDMNYHRNNGNSLAFDQVQRETRRSQSHDYNFNLGIARDFYRGTLEFGAGYLLRDFDAGTGIGDGENTFGDVGWMTTPSFAPKSSMGLGVRVGSDNYDGQTSQESFTPSYRWRYRLSGKTSLNQTIGYEFRSIDTPGAQDTENLVFKGGIDWRATGKMGFGLAYYRNVQPSYILNGQDSTNTGITLQMINDLPGRFELTSRVGYENAEYSSNTGVVPGASRDDKFLRLALDLSHPLMITEKLRGEWAIFYNFNQNDSTLSIYAFDQNVAGIRIGLVY